MRRTFLLLFLAFFVFGCGSDSGERQMQHDFKQGVAEVQFNLLENAPPERIYSNSAFSIIVEVDNQVAYNIEQGNLRIIGLDEQYFEISPRELQFALLGKGLTSPEGERTYLEFEGNAGSLFQNAEEYVGNYFLKASYISMIDFTDTVCVNSDLYVVYDAGCEVDSEKSFSGQGAPLVVTNMEEIISPGSEIEFRLELKNKGQGEIKNVLLKRAQLGGEDLTCFFKGEIEGLTQIEFSDDEQEAVLICKKTLGGKNSYTTSLSLSFEYSYELKEQHRLKLVR